MALGRRFRASGPRLGPCAGLRPWPAALGHRFAEAILGHGAKSCSHLLRGWQSSFTFGCARRASQQVPTFENWSATKPRLSHGTTSRFVASTGFAAREMGGCHKTAFGPQERPLPCGSNAVLWHKRRRHVTKTHWGHRGRGTLVVQMGFCDSSRFGMRLCDVSPSKCGEVVRLLACPGCGCCRMPCAGTPSGRGRGASGPLRR